VNPDVALPVLVEVVLLDLLVVLDGHCCGVDLWLVRAVAGIGRKVRSVGVRNSLA
jgi:hypothetical protein